MGSQQSTVGVRTRARTLALRRLQDSSSSCYLELRSRRLEKPTSKAAFKESPNPSPRSKNGKSSSNPSPYPRLGEGEEAEASFGENVVDVDAVARNVRETTPCSLIRDSETIATPGSTTRRSNSNNSRRGIQNAVNRNIPTSYEMEEFFACAERLQQRIFTDKYNFDPVNDCPLPGRYEWVKVE
ncbi:cyclin-dependent kinase inhibitor 4-like [Asparagus officinalis]|uniref:cyclin-dependent kinase inhibitor 4-like n=1 Tax=Asparagus officinalis TaxID=4686 RepID=UPI00098E5F8D|nr:cyclin-dependent kinase inhibitor 4-like [Asparagus officinalis]